VLTSLVLVDGPVTDDVGVKADVKPEVVVDEAVVVLEADEMLEEALVEVVV